MTKSRQPKLKVFQAQFGFFDTVVAAPSQAAALRAWGIHQNLFANGEAKTTDDKAAVAAALAHPETPLRRAVGSSEPFQLEPTSLPKVPNVPRQAAAKTTTKTKAALPSKPPPDRSRLDVAEAALHRLDEARKFEEAGFRRRQSELDQAKANAQATYVEGHKKAMTAVVALRKAYQAEGGED